MSTCCEQRSAAPEAAADEADHATEAAAAAEPEARPMNRPPIVEIVLVGLCLVLTIGLSWWLS